MNLFSLIILELVGFVILIALSKNVLILDNSNVSDDNKQAHKSLDRDYLKKIISYRIIFFILLLFEIVISLIFKGYPSINFLYFFIWLVSFIIVLNKLAAEKNNKLINMCIKGNCDGNSFTKVNNDNLNNSINNERVLPIYSFIGAVLISIISLLIIIFNSNENSYLVIAIVELLLKGIAIFLYKVTVKKHEVKYIQNTKVNNAINSQKNRMWSVFWVLFSTMDSLIFLLLAISISKIIYINYIYILIIYIAAISIAIIYLFVKRKNIRLNLEALEKHDDIIIPLDDRFLIENGIGYKVNLNTIKGKVFVYSILIFVMVILLFFTISDFYVPNIKINKNYVVVQDLDYSHNFKISDIKNVTMSKDIHIINKIYGTETLKYARGEFNVDKYGKSQVYIFKDSDDYIIIKLNGINIIYNESNENKTLKAYKKLLNAIAIYNE